MKKYILNITIAELLENENGVVIDTGRFLQSTKEISKDDALTFQEVVRVAGIQ